MQYRTISQVVTPRQWPSHEHQVYAGRRSGRKRSAAALVRRVEAAVPLTPDELAAILVGLAVNAETNGVHR